MSRSTVTAPRLPRIRIHRKGPTSFGISSPRFTCREWVEVLINGVGDGSVGERERVRVLAQRCSRVCVSEPSLGLEDLASLDEERGHVAPESVQRGPVHARSARESVAKGASCQPSSMVDAGTEQPRPKLSTGPGSRPPIVFELVPEHRVAVPIVSVRSRPAFGVPITSADAARAM